MTTQQTATTTATKKKTTAAKLRDLFLEKKELTATEARRLLKSQGRKMSYSAIVRLFYDLRQLNLIQFTRSEAGRAPIEKRYHRIVPGMEQDNRWNSYPHALLYPSARIGGLNYQPGTSVGRAKKYERKD